MVQEIDVNSEAKILWLKAGHPEDKFKPNNEAYHILTIYWFLFIYFSLAAMDELIEAFSVIN